MTEPDETETTDESADDEKDEEKPRRAQWIKIAELDVRPISGGDVQFVDPPSND